MLLVAACATAPAPVAAGKVEMRLLPGQSRVAEIDGPYAVFSRIGHGVLLRVWPDSIADGLVDMTVIVRNGELDSINLDSANIVARGETGPLTIYGRDAMLARFDAGSVRRRMPGASIAVRPTGGNTGELETFSDSSALETAPIETGEPEQEDDRSRAAQRSQIAAWYLGRLDIAPGQTVTGGLSLQLPEASQTILVNVLIDQEDHEFALLFER